MLWGEARKASQESHAARYGGTHFASTSRNQRLFGHYERQGEKAMATQLDVDRARLEEFMGQVVTDMAAAESSALMYVGERLGLYRAMAGAGSLTPQQLAERTGTHERYVREWLNNQAAGGYVAYDPDNGTYELPNERALVLADDSSPVFIGGLFRTGEGVGWHEHDHRLFHGVERLFGPIYRGNLTAQWIPALDGVEARLRAGAGVADIGCGHGVSTILMAQAYPNSTFYGFDYHEESIEAAKKAAVEAGVEDRVTFEMATAKDFPGSGYDLICFFDCLHDMGDPVGAAAYAREALSEDGTVMLVEPIAGDNVEDNFNPVGRLYYAGSTFLCTPSSLAQEVGLGLGAQAGEARLGQVMSEAGYGHFRRATETPFNLVLEARP
jgi:2-polyprenyl-3-methyl-5-hydroxy-6-metoxy-1,4-benzoquinol methylase